MGTETVVRCQDLIAVVTGCWCVNFINSLSIVSKVRSMSIYYIYVQVLGVLIILLRFIFISFHFYWDPKYCDSQY